MSSWGRIYPGSSGESGFKICQCIFTILWLSPLWEGVGPSYNKTESDALCQVWLKMSQWFWRRRLQNVFNNVFLLFCNYLHLKKGVTLYFIWKKLNHLHPGRFVSILVENGSVLLEKNIFKSSQCIFTISQLYPLWERCGPSFKQTWIPFTQGCYVPSLIEIGPLVLEKKIFF